MASNARSGVKSPVLKPSEPGGAGEISQRETKHGQQFHSHGPGSQERTKVTASLRSRCLRPLPKNPKGTLKARSNLRLDNWSDFFCWNIEGNEEAHRGPVVGTNVGLL